MPVAMRTMPRLLLLLFCMSMVTMMFIARCGLSMDGQFHSGQHGGLPVSSSGSPAERALREVMRRKEVEYSRDRSMLQEKIKSLETQLAKVQGQVVNLTANLNAAEETLGRVQAKSNKNPNIDQEDGRFLRPGNDAGGNNNDYLINGPGINSKRVYAHGSSESVDTRLVYHNDGLNPLPRYHSQDDGQNLLPMYRLQNDGPDLLPRYRSQSKFPVFSPDERKPLYYVENNTFLQTGEVHRLGLDERGGVPGQFENVFQRQPFGNLNSFESRERMNYKTGIINDAAEGNGETVRVRDDEVVIKDDVFLRAVETAGISRSDKRTAVVEQGYVPEDENNPYQSYNDSKRDTTNNDDRVTAGHSQLDYNKYFLERLRMTEVLKGQQYKTEYELIPFNRFIFNRVFLVDPGLGKRVVEKPIGSKKKDLNEILYFALEMLNKNRTDKIQYTYNDFLEGMYRSDPSSGSHYELIFLNKDSTDSKHPRSYTKLSIFRPFAPPMAVHHEVVNTDSEWINIILPLSKRVDTFRIFMQQFVTVCIKRDRRIYLTVVYFGTDGLQEVKSIMSHVAKTHKFKYMKLVTLNETFARGRGLQIGALNWKGGGDVLLFFCDVDIVFTSDFLERCRLNTEKGQRVYYPIIFSLYNPKIVYSLQDVPMPSFHDQLVLSKDTGFWRDFGYGMTCLYRSDFLKIKGFDEQITGWGGEDVFLYQKFVRSEYFVVRATDPSIFHLWHEKVCDPTLSAEQYRSCIRSKALNEASHAQLGLLAFKDEIDIHRGMSEKNSLLNKYVNG